MSPFAWGVFGWTSLACLGGVFAVCAVSYAAAFAVKRHNVIDTAWGLSFVVSVLIADLVTSNSAHHTPSGRRLLITVLVAIWGLRLSGYMAVRGRGQGEDPRYAEMLATTSGNRNLYALRAIYLPQLPAMWFVSLPLQVSVVGAGSVGVLGWIGAAVWLIGFVFEAGGDAQLARFRRDAANKGKVLDTGLWRLTRHPNYFGDACQWWGFSLIAFAHWPGVLTILSPVLMTWFLAKKTGKPLLERRMADTRPGYREYIERTSGFFPLPPGRIR
jgi:steroid 5-alpha reductase family enzyme